MPFPFAAAAAGAGAVLSFLGGRDEARARRRAQRWANETLARILPVQQQQFNARYNLTNILNNLLMANEGDRFNQVGEREVRYRGEVGDESVARFDEQASAVSGQLDENRTNVRDLIDSIAAVTRGRVGAYEGERDRQVAIQAQGDAAGQDLLGNVGSVADAVNRAIAGARRTALATDTIGAAPGGGEMPATTDRVSMEFARRAQEANTTALGDASAAATVGAYGDARSAEDVTLANFTSVIDRLRKQAEISRASLAPELAALDRGAENAVGRFEGRSALTNMVARNRRDLADTYRSGRIAAIGSAADGDVNSLENFFARMAQNYQTGYGGQVEASANYENLFSNLMRERASRILGQTPSTSGMSSLGSLLSGLSSVLPGG